MPRYYIEEDENNPGQVIKRLIDGSYVNYNAAPIGAVEQCAGATIPPGWLQCNGQAVSRTYYSYLFNTIGTTYGAGDGTTTFNVPTMSNLVPNVKFMIKAESTLNGNYLGIEGGGATYADNPLGTILSFGGTTAPDGWELCHGQLLSRTEYADLFAVIGTNFGAGDGSTTFKLPDLRGEFLRGAGTNSHTNQGDGSTIGDHQDATEVPTFITRHNSANSNTFVSYTYNNTTNNAPSNIDKSVPLPAANGVGTNNIITGSDYSTTVASIRFSTRPTNTSVEFIIKVKKTDVPIDLMSSIKDMAKDVYSTGEVKTNKVWIDGKPIYRKVIQDTTPATGNNTFGTNNNNKTIQMGTTCDNIIDIRGYVKYTNDVNGMIDVQTSDAQWVSVWGRNKNHSTMPNSLGVACGTSSVSLPITLIVEYTKG